MSRIDIDEEGDAEEDFPGQAAFYHANTARSLQGKKGQASLRELEQALLALPEKRLVSGEFETPEGEVCAIGALKRFKGVEHVEHDPSTDMDLVGEELGMPRLVAWMVVARNDHSFEDLNDDERYRAMLGWVRHQLRSSV